MKTSQLDLWGDAAPAATSRPAANLTAMPEPIIPLPASDFAGDLWNESRTFSAWEAWVDLRHQAATSNTPNQAEGSVRKLADRWRWSKSRVSRFLSEMEARGAIKRRTGKSKGMFAGHPQTVIEFCNTVTYCGESDNERDSKRDAIPEPQQDTVVLFPEPEQPKPEPFDLKAIWQAFPQKARARSSQRQLEAEWKRVPAKDRPSFDSLLQSIKAWAASEDWTKDGGQYAPGAHRFIKCRKWEDTPAAPVRRAVNYGVGHSPGPKSYL